MKMKKFLVLFAVIVAIFALASFTASAEELHGWQYSDGNWYYYEYGTKWVDTILDYEDDLYRLGEDGAMLTSSWFENEYGGKYYFGADGKGYKYGRYEIDGEFYYFDYTLRTNGMIYSYEYIDDIYYPIYYFADENGVLVANEWIQPNLSDGDDDWYYFGADNRACRQGKYLIDGDYYYFGYNGNMYDEKGLYSNWDPETDTYTVIYVTENGTLARNGWLQPELEEFGDDSWYYFKDDATACSDGVFWIYDAYYGFSGGGQMFDDTTFSYDYYNEELEEWITTGRYRAKEGGKLYCNEWYYQPYSNGRQYYMSDCKVAIGPVYVDGVQYLFSEWGWEITYSAAEITNPDGTKSFYYVDGNGNITELFNNNWTQINNEWYYVQNNSICMGDIYTIGGVTYYFTSNGAMLEQGTAYQYIYDPELNDYVDKIIYAKSGGALARNEWIEYNSYWYYFGDDYYGYTDGIYQIGQYLYYFDSWSEAYENTVVSYDGVVYAIDKDCHATAVTGWFKHPRSTDNNPIWMFASNGDYLTETIVEIGGIRYAFDYDGFMITDGISSDEYDKYYLFGADGAAITQSGWHTVNGKYVYVTGDGSLHFGWLDDIYYLTPYLSHNTIMESDGYLYAVNTYGHQSKINHTGFFTLSGDIVYLNGGKLLTDDWLYDNDSDAWYYFDYDGCMVRNVRITIDGYNYYFDGDGKMAFGGWVRGANGYWYYANANGTLYSGAIDGDGYLFDSYGRLRVNNTALLNGTYYVTDHNGIVVKALSEGWTPVGNDWYLIEDGYLVTYEYESENGLKYYFDSNGKMYTNRKIDDIYYGSDGAALSGWFLVDGKWYYGDKDNYYLYSGLATINGKEYFFKNYVLQQNTTSVYDGMLLTTNADGVVISKAYGSGWAYSEDAGYGYVYYLGNGSNYTGWIGDYYIEYGRLVTNSTVYYNGNRYYVRPNGLCAYNGWIEINEYEWKYARKDGTLYYDEWLQLGDTWYYFDGTHMAYDGIYTIDGIDYLFAENGVYIGRVADTAGYADGWVAEGDKWRYSFAGEFVAGRELYIDGAWYYFDYYGYMISEEFAYSRSDYSDSFYYYTKDGYRADYHGWVWLNNGWCYFDETGAAPAYIWINDNGKYYYQTFGYNDTEYPEVIRMVTGYYSINGELCYFNNDGAYEYTVTANGWYYSDFAECWYYVSNGKLLTDETVIGEIKYCFYDDGSMVANTIYDGVYYNADGLAITTEGWYYVFDEWIYVTKSGHVAESGIFLINGVEYAFRYFAWVG